MIFRGGEWHIFNEPRGKIIRLDSPLWIAKSFKFVLRDRSTQTQVATKLVGMDLSTLKVWFATSLAKRAPVRCQLSEVSALDHTEHVLEFLHNLITTQKRFEIQIPTQIVHPTGHSPYAKIIVSLKKDESENMRNKHSEFHNLLS